MSDKLYEEAVTTARKAMAGFISTNPFPGMDKVKEAVQKALKQLLENTYKIEVTCDPKTGEVFCSFYVDPTLQSTFHFNISCPEYTP